MTQFQYERLSKIANQRTFPFLNNAKILLDQMEPLILGFAESIEKEYGLKDLVDEVKIGKPYWILRYLHYFANQKQGTEIAAPHADKGGISLHLYESHRGLQYYCSKDLSWKPMPVHPKQTVIFPSLQLQLRSEGELNALYHRVVATEETQHVGRFSMVCFICLENTPKYRKGALGNVQSQKIGFNYSLSPTEFREYFF